MDAGDADEEVVEVALDDLERVLVLASLRVREASTRASGRARGRGDDGWGSRMWTRETLTLRTLELPQETIASSPPFPYAALRPRRATDVSDAGRLRRS